MEIIETFDKYSKFKLTQVTNYDVYKLVLQETNKAKESIVPLRNHTELADLTSVQVQILNYFSKTSVELITSQNLLLFEKLGKFKLEKAELLQLFNLQPDSIVTLFLVVEECDQRFTPAEQQEILDIIKETMPFIEPEPEDETMEDQMES